MTKTQVEVYRPGEWRGIQIRTSFSEPLKALRSANRDPMLNAAEGESLVVIERQNILLRKYDVASAIQIAEQLPGLPKQRGTCEGVTKPTSVMYLRGM